MGIGITEFHHVNVTVPREIEQAARDFYAITLGLKEVPKPAASQARGGAWYQLGDVQLHLSIEERTEDNTSTRHVCFLVDDLKQAQERLSVAGVEILSDPRPIPGTRRFYVRDPGNNLIEIAEKNNEGRSH